MAPAAAELDPCTDSPWRGDTAGTAGELIERDIELRAPGRGFGAGGSGAKFLYARLSMEVRSRLLGSVAG